MSLGGVSRVLGTSTLNPGGMDNAIKKRYISSGVGTSLLFEGCEERHPESEEQENSVPKEEGKATLFPALTIHLPLTHHLQPFTQSTPGARQSELWVFVAG